MRWYSVPMAFKPRSDECGSPGCEELRDVDSYLCEYHRELVRPVKEALADEEDPYGTRTREGKKPVPRCTRPGCRNPRKAGASMCADCEEEAFWDSGSG